MPTAPAPSIRPLRPADRGAWQPLWEGYLRFYREELAPATTEATFARLSGEADGTFALVADGPGGELRGFAHCVVHPSTWHVGPTVYLEDLFVGPEARGTDLARALIEAVCARARELDAERVYWHTQQYNGRARSLYDTVARLSSHIVYEREP